jgi:Zn finger protein HypA/HybF involved in hydrogenase expression
MQDIYIGCEIMNLSVWCDQCEGWADEFKPDGNEILCAKCDNCLIRNLPMKQQKQIRKEIAKAIWHLS